MRDEWFGHLKIQFEGRTVLGRYSLSGGMIKVISDGGGSKAMQLAGLVSHEDLLAERLLRELAQEGQA